MSFKKLGLIHTSSVLVPVFTDLCKEAFPQVEIFHISDDSLIKDVIKHQELRPVTARRVVQYVASAEEAGADQILVTCSSIGRAVEMAATLTKIPVLRVDQPMADQAVKTAGKIGVLATLSTTLEPTSDLISRRAKLAGKEILLVPRLCEGAFEALISGNPGKHDEIVSRELLGLMNDVEVIILAQASMARILQLIPADKLKIPVLSSPATAINFLARQL